MADLYTRVAYNEDHPLSKYATFLEDCKQKGYINVQCGAGPWVDGLTVLFIAACRHEDGHVFAWQVARFRDEGTRWKITSFPYGLNFKTEADFETYCQQRKMNLQEVTTLLAEIERVKKQATAA